MKSARRNAPEWFGGSNFVDIDSELRGIVDTSRLQSKSRHREKIGGHNGRRHKKCQEETASQNISSDFGDPSDHVVEQLSCAVKIPLLNRKPLAFLSDGSSNDRTSHSLSNDIRDPSDLKSNGRSSQTYRKKTVPLPFITTRHRANSETFSQDEESVSDDILSYSDDEDPTHNTSIKHGSGFAPIHELNSQHKSYGALLDAKVGSNISPTSHAIFINQGNGATTAGEPLRVSSSIPQNSDRIPMSFISTSGKVTLSQSPKTSEFRLDCEDHNLGKGGAGDQNCPITPERLHLSDTHSSPESNLPLSSGFRPPRPHMQKLNPPLFIPIEPQQPEPKKKERSRFRKTRDSAMVREAYIKSIIGPTILDQNAELASNQNHFKLIDLKDSKVLAAFLLQICIIAYVAIRYGGLTIMIGVSSSSSSSTSDSFKNIPSKENYDNPFAIPSSSTGFSSSPSGWIQDIYVDYKNAMYIATVASLYSSSLTLLTIGIMMVLHRSFIQTALCFTVVTCFTWGTVGVALSPYNFVPILGIIALAFTLGYTIVVWDRIPFAATVLNTALSCMRCTADIVSVACSMMCVALAWTVCWAFASLGLYDHILAQESDFTKSHKDRYALKDLSIFVLLLLSYFWTLNVVLNIVQVITASTICTWWYHPEKISCCGSACTKTAFIRSVSTSLGSICFGSLFVPPLQTIRVVIGACCFSYGKVPPKILTRRNSEIAIIHDDAFNSEISTLTSQRSSYVGNVMLDSINEFAFVVLAMSDVDFLSAGHKAFTVFKAKESQDAVSDRLIPNVLLTATLLISFSSGCFALVVEEFDGYNFTNFKKPMSTAFLIGSWIGFVSSSVLLKVVGSSVRTVLLCSAVAPVEFERNHPSLSHNMRQTWGEYRQDGIV